MWHITDLLAGERNATWVGVSPAQPVDGLAVPGTADAAVDLLDRAYQVFRGHVAAIDTATLAHPMGPVTRYYADSSRASFVLHELDELLHHGAEIAVLRDLYRALPASRTGRPAGSAS
jgi:hypothetical protein